MPPPISIFPPLTPSPHISVRWTGGHDAGLNCLPVGRATTCRKTDERETATTQPETTKRRILCRGQRESAERSGRVPEPRAKAKDTGNGVPRERCQTPGDYHLV